MHRSIEKLHDTADARRKIDYCKPMFATRKKHGENNGAQHCQSGKERSNEKKKFGDAAGDQHWDDDRKKNLQLKCE